MLVNGATGTAGRLAVQIARHLGAKKIIATARNAAALDSVATLGADVAIPMVEDEAALENRFKRAALSAFLNERASLSPDMAIRIEQAFGVSMETLMRMQNSFDIAQARRRAGEISVARYVPAPTRSEPDGKAL